MNTTATPVTLREITADTVRAVTKLSVREDQTRFVASNAMSLAQALITPEGHAMPGWRSSVEFARRPAAGH